MSHFYIIAAVFETFTNSKKCPEQLLSSPYVIDVITPPPGFFFSIYKHSD